MAKNGAVDNAEDVASGAEHFVADKAVQEAQDTTEVEVYRTTTDNMNQAKDEAIGFSNSTADYMNEQAANAADYVANAASDAAA
jgi:hypothetical protein